MKSNKPQMQRMLYFTTIKELVVANWLIQKDTAENSKEITLKELKHQ